MASNRYAGASPLSTNANIGNVPNEPRSGSSSALAAKTISFRPPMPPTSPRRSGEACSARSPPFRPRTPHYQRVGQSTPSSTRPSIGSSALGPSTPGSISSLPRRHYPAPASPALSRVDPRGGDEDGGSESSVSSLGPLSTESTHGSLSSSGPCNKKNEENRSPLTHSPACLDEIKSKLARNKLRRESPNLRSILSSASKDRGVALAVERAKRAAAAKGTSCARNDVCNAAGRMGKRDAREIDTGTDKSHRSKRYKVNLAPRIAAGGSVDGRASTQKETPARTDASVFRATSGATSMQRRTEKCLWNALEIMHSRSHDSNKPKDMRSACGSGCSGESEASSAMFVRLRASLGAHRTGSEIGNQPRSEVGSHASSAAGRWLRRSQARSDAGASSTFSVSPLAKEAQSVSSYIGSVQLDSKGNECRCFRPKEASGDASAMEPRGEVEAAETMSVGSGVQRAQSFPPDTIDDGRCLVQVPSDMTTDNEKEGEIDSLSPVQSPQCKSTEEEKDTLSPLPSLKNKQLYTASPAPSFAPSYATTATGGTDGTEATNLFDMLRTFNHGSESDGSDNEGLEVPSKQTATSSRPPLSPIPMMEAKQRRTCTKSERGSISAAKAKPVRRAKPMEATPKAMSPLILRGTPCLTPQSDTAASSFLNGSSVVDENTPNFSAAEDEPDQSRCEQLEYSFLASALVATNILAASPAKSAKNENSTRATTPLASSRASHELNYASIGATASAIRKTPAPRRVDPMALTFEAETLSPILDSSTEGHDELASRKKQRTASSAPDETTDTTMAQRAKARDDILSIASALDGDSSTGSKGDGEAENRPATRYLGGGGLASSAPESEGGVSHDEYEASKLRERIMWLEKVLGFGRGANAVFEGEIRELKEKVAILERRLEEEMIMREEATQKASGLMADIEAAKDAHRSVEEGLREKLASLKAELEAQRTDRDNNEPVNEGLKERLQAVKTLAKEERDEMEELRRTNEGLLQRQRTVEKELVSCANDNDTLRQRLLSLANDASTKEHTLSTALSQLRSLSESHGRANQSLEHEQTSRRKEVFALQSTLDDASRRLTKTSERVSTLQAENDGLREELRKVRLEKMRSTAFHRTARGG